MDLSKIYSLRQKFTIIAVTGRAGSGCTKIAQKLSQGFQVDSDVYPNSKEFLYPHNSYRKYRIVYKYASQNFKPFHIIYYKDILIAFILKYTLDDLICFLDSDELKDDFAKSKLKTQADFSSEIEELKKEEALFSLLHLEANELINDSKKNGEELTRLFDFFNSAQFKTLSERIHSILMSKSLIKRNKTLQSISNNQRGFGHPYKNKSFDPRHIYSIAELINDLIKSIRINNGDRNTKIVIDSLRNPFEIMFFKQRLAAFYTLAINRKDEKRNRELSKRVHLSELTDLNILLKEEHSGAMTSEFYKQNVSLCIQNADVHITYISKKEAALENKYRIKNNEKTSPYFSWGMQLLKFLALIDHPGIITPSPEERCMQLAYTAKYNSGCLSRQVGAAITDENYSLKAIGWNNTPEGHVPCILRNVEDLIKSKEDLSAFTPFERHDKNFKKVLVENYQSQIERFKVDLNGNNVSYCFKSLINSISEGKNQVHTRSLHAEESAFLQISKYGGVGIQNGKLFTTASPCELCSKKAYQLGIKIIYFIDPYPGISNSQILLAGQRDRNPKLRLFNGAIGNAYHWLYEPVMPYKEELALILENSIVDLTKKYKADNERLENENRVLKETLLKYKANYNLSDETQSALNNK
jgi:deoxycytidylate deaminase